jgi:hypothetical protein
MGTAGGAKAGTGTGACSFAFSARSCRVHHTDQTLVTLLKLVTFALVSLKTQSVIAACSLYVGILKHVHIGCCIRDAWWLSNFDS